jgi:hypothetical protein
VWREKDRDTEGREKDRDTEGINKINDEGWRLEMLFSVEFRRAFYSSTQTIAYFDICSRSTAVIVEPSSRICSYCTRDQVVYFASSDVCFGFRNCDLLFRSTGNDKLTLQVIQNGWLL